MRLQTRLVKLNSYKPENKTENPAKERDFFILYDQNLPRNGNTPYLSTRSSSSSTSKKNLRYLSYHSNAATPLRMDRQRYIFLTNILSILNQAYIEQGASTLIYKYRLLYSI